MAVCRSLDAVAPGSAGGGVWALATPRRAMAAVVVQTARLRIGSAPSSEMVSPLPSAFRSGLSCPPAIGFLLLASDLSVSTQSTVTTPRKTGPSGLLLHLACWLWLAGVIVATLLALAEGAAARSLAFAAIWALARD